MSCGIVHFIVHFGMALTVGVVLFMRVGHKILVTNLLYSLFACRTDSAVKFGWFFMFYLVYPLSNKTSFHNKIGM